LHVGLKHDVQVLHFTFLNLIEQLRKAQPTCLLHIGFLLVHTFLSNLASGAFVFYGIYWVACCRHIF